MWVGVTGLLQNFRVLLYKIKGMRGDSLEGLSVLTVLEFRRGRSGKASWRRVVWVVLGFKG